MDKDIWGFTYVCAASLVSDIRPPNDLDLPRKDMALTRVIAEPDVFGVYRGYVHRPASVVRILELRVHRCLGDRSAIAKPPVACSG